MDGDFTEIIPTWLLNAEFQASILLGLTCVGAWVIVSWILQVVFSFMWPFFFVVTVLIVMPQWRRTIARDLLPKYAEMFKNFGQRIVASYNTSDVEL